LIEVRQLVYSCCNPERAFWVSRDC